MKLVKLPSKKRCSFVIFLTIARWAPHPITAAPLVIISHLLQPALVVRNSEKISQMLSNFEMIVSEQSYLNDQAAQPFLEFRAHLRAQSSGSALEIPDKPSMSPEL